MIQTKRILEVIQDGEVILANSEVSLGAKKIESIALEVGKRVYKDSLWLWVLANRNKAVLIDCSVYPFAIHGLVVLRCLSYIATKRYQLEESDSSQLEKGSKLAVEVFKVRTPKPEEMISPEKLRESMSLINRIGMLSQAPWFFEYFPEVKYMLTALRKYKYIDDNGKLRTPIKNVISYLVSETKPKLRICPVCLSTHSALSNQFFCNDCKKLRYTIQERYNTLKGKNPRIKSLFDRLRKLCKKTYTVDETEKIEKALKEIKHLKDSLSELFKEPRKYTLSKQTTQGK